ncbi:MAG: hypothetical protein EXS10_09190 [Phycisphaerales bacterium]|nr:hypothetical protein [Phycisphaerales bacterium]
MQISHRARGWSLTLALSALVFMGACRSTERRDAPSDAPNATVVPAMTSTPSIASPSRSNAPRSLESFRAPITVLSATEDAAVVPSELVDAVRSALSAKDLPRAADAVVALLRVAPKSRAAREALVAVQLLQRNAEGAREALEELRTVAPDSPLLLAIYGLEAEHNGQHAEAVGALAWFVGDDALTQATSFGALPLDAGSVEEALLNGCLALGARDAAIETARALIARAASSAAEQSLMRCSLRARLLAGDLAQSQGDRSEAVEYWHEVASADGFEAELARWRLAADAVREGDRSADHECLRILEDPSSLLRDEPALLRLAWIVTHAKPEMELSDASVRAAELAVLLPEDFRMQCIAARLGDASARARVRGQAPRVWSTDPFAYRLAVAGAALESAADAIDLARASLALDVASLEVAASALVWSGLRLTTLQSALEPANDDVSRALWSVVLCSAGLPEDGYAVAQAMPESQFSDWRNAAMIVAAGALHDATLTEDAHRNISDARAIALASLRVHAWRMALDPLRAVQEADRAAEELAQEDNAALVARRAHFLFEAARGRVETGSATKAAREFLRAQVLNGAADAQAAWLTLAGTRGDDCPPPPTIALRALVAGDALASIGSPLAAEVLALATECSPDVTAVAQLRFLAARGDVFATQALANLGALHPADSVVGRGLLANDKSSLGVLEARRVDRFDPSAYAKDFSRPSTAAFSVTEAERAHRGSNDEGALAMLASALAQPNVSDSVLVRAFALLVELRAADPDNNGASQPSFDEVVQRLLASTQPIAPLWAIALYDTSSSTSSDPDALLAVARNLAPRIALGAQGASQCFLLSGRLLAREEPEYAAHFANALAAGSIADPSIRAQLARHAIALDALSGGRESESLATIHALRALGADPYLREPELANNATISLAESIARASGTYALLGNDAGASMLNAEALRIDPEHAESLNNLAYAALERGVWDETCERAAIHAAELAPDNASFLDTLGLLRYRKGELQDGSNGPGALTLFRSALRLSPRDPSMITMLHLGDALWLTGDQEGAVKCWQQIGQIATLRYPPREIAQSLALLQRAQFGMQLVDPSEFLQREYGKTVTDAEHRLQAVARGESPAVGSSKAMAAQKVQVDDTH